MAIFISYSTIDHKETDIVYKSLDNNNVKCWKADIQLREYGGEEYETEIVKQIEQCDAFVVVYSRNAIDSRWVNGEITLAFNSNKRIITFFIENIDFGQKHKLKLPQFQSITIKDGWDLALSSLYKSIVRIISANVVTSTNDIPNEKHKEIMPLDHNRSKVFFSKLFNYLTNNIQ